MTTHGFTGTLRLILPLMDLVHMSLLLHREGKLLVRSNERIGTISIKRGQVIDARAEEAVGEEAFFKMALWRSGDFMFASVAVDESRRSIFCDGNSLLIEAARRQDEMSDGRASEPTVVFGCYGDAPPTPLQQAYQEFLREAESREFQLDRAPDVPTDESSPDGQETETRSVAHSYARFFEWLKKQTRPRA